LRSNSDALRIAITPGEPGGIGPDLVLALAAEGALFDAVVIADPELLTARAHQLGLAITLVDPNIDETAPGQLRVCPMTAPGSHTAGIADPANARYLLQTLDTAVRGCEEGRFHALVTGPLNKQSINASGIAFSGHTEYLADLTRTPKVVMMLASPSLRVALMTTHLPLRSVADAITEETIKQTISILHDALRRDFGVTSPRILVAGLNPHAGEGGYLGREEIEVIEPALVSLRAAGYHLSGPLPADTLFTPRYLEQADAVLAMYHDQGLPVLKYQGFGEAVNITLGLPIIRTSVDHGTALELAGTGTADTGSLRHALQYARNMATHRRQGI